MLPLVLVAGLVAFYPSAGLAPSGGQFTLGASTISREQYLPIGQALDLSPEPKTVIPKIQLASSAALVRDVGSGLTLFSKNSEKIYPIASLTKLMTAVVADKAGKLGDIVEIDPRDEKVSEFRAGFRPGEKFYALDLVKAMLISSANDAAYALARHIAGSPGEFAELMNLEALRLGMLSTSFSNPVGFDDPKNFSTAEDLSKLIDEFLKHESLKDIPSVRETVIAAVNDDAFYRLVNTNRLLGLDPEVIGLKTGYTYEARGNLVALVSHERLSSPSRPAVFYSIILGSDDREGETMKILKWVRESFIWK